MNADNFIWTSEEYSCSELREKFDNKFPVIALVTFGYYGDKPQEQIPEETIIRIHDWGVQQRAVARDHRGRYITLPTNYPVKIQQLLKTLEPVGKLLTVQEFLNNHVLPKTAQMDKQEVEELYVGDRSELFGILEMIHVYAEKFFKVNIFRAGSLDINNTYVVPNHLGMKFKVALGMKASSADDWTQWLKGINRSTDNVPYSSIEGIPDIFIYNNEALGWDFNLELPVYHVRHPLTLRPGMDRDSWSMCISNNSAKRKSQYGRENTEDPRDVQFNATTGMRQPSFPTDVQNELFKKLGISSKKEEATAKPGKFAAHHEMLLGIFGSGHRNAPSAERLPEPDYEVGKKKAGTADDDNRMQEFKRNSYLKQAVHQAAERQVSRESELTVDYEQSNVGGSSRPSSQIGQVQDNSGQYGSISGGEIPYGYTKNTTGLSVADPDSYSYGGRPPLRNSSRNGSSSGYPSSHAGGKSKQWEEVERLWNNTNFESRNFAKMSPEQVAQCLQRLGMEEHIQKFLDNGVDGLVLLNLSKQDLRRDFGMSGLSASKLMRFARI